MKMARTAFRFANPAGVNKPVYLMDGNDDIWWIDHDGDLLSWVSDDPIPGPHQVRQTPLKLDCKSVSDEQVQEEFNNSPVIVEY